MVKLSWDKESAAESLLHNDSDIELTVITSPSSTSVSNKHNHLISPISSSTSHDLLTSFYDENYELGTSRSKALETQDINDHLSKTLRHIPGSIPPIAYMICLVELAERASYYGLTACISNFVQRNLPTGSTTGAVVDHDNINESAGALGLGLPLASFLTQLLSFLAYLSPLLGGYLSDTKYGRFKTVVIGTIIGFIGHFILVLAALPIVIQTVWFSFALTAIAIVTISMSAGFIKPTLFPLLMDQYTYTEDYLKRLDSGELVIVDYKSTLERISLIFYFFINFGCAFSVVSSLLERAYGFWVVFAFTGLLYSCLPIILFILKPKLKLTPPSGVSTFTEVIPLLKDLFGAGWQQRLKTNRFWSIEQTRTTSISLPDLKRTLESCAIFLFFVPFNLNDGAISSIQVNQAGTMETNGIPNDIFQSFNPFAIIVFIPLQDFIIYPFLRKHRIEFPARHRITVGFLLAALGSLIGALLQAIIYNTSECGWQGATNCKTVAPISAWWCSWMFSLQAIGECFATVTCYELAYSRSGENMKGLVMAFFLSSYAVSAFIGEIISLGARDPYLFAIFTGCGISGVVFAGVFARRFRNLEG